MLLSPKPNILEKRNLDTVCFVAASLFLKVKCFCPKKEKITAEHIEINESINGMEII